MRPPRTLCYNGERLTMQEWAKRTGVSVSTLTKRLDSGWSVRETLTTPVLPLGHRRISHEIRDRSDRCVGCRYARRLWRTGGETSPVYCAYLEIMGHRRPCPADRCTAREEAE